MSATVHNMPSSQLAQLQRLLDEAETDRTRLNRRIRRIRDLLKSARDGEELPPLDDLLDLLPTARPVHSFPAATPPAPAAPPPAATSPFAGHLGDGLPAGVPSTVPLPPAPPAAAPASVDVGHLVRLSPEELDRLPYGVVTLDSRGRIIGYNDTESRLAGLPRDAVIGRDFFREVAPCTAVRDFEGRFRDFADGRSRLALETFEFVFNFRNGAQRVLILISPARIRGRFHVSMIRR